MVVGGGELSIPGLHYWAKDNALANARFGQYIQYPVSADDNEVTKWVTGVVSKIGSGSENGEPFNLVVIVGLNGEQLSPSTVPADMRHYRIKLLSPDDGYYRVRAVEGRKATLDKLYPSQGSIIQNWRGFNNIIHGKIKVNALTSLPGSPAGSFFCLPEIGSDRQGLCRYQVAGWPGVHE